LLLELIAGYDHLDSTTVEQKIDKYTEYLDTPIQGKTIGIPKEFFGEGIDQEVKRKVQSSFKELEQMGVEITEISLPHLKYSIPTYYIIAMSEARSNLARFDGLRYGKMVKISDKDIFETFSHTRGEKFGEEVRRRIILGTYALSAGYYNMFYIKALKVRSLIRQDFRKAFETCDLIVSPTMPTTAFKIGELVDDPLQMYLMDVLTCPVNLAGLPALSIPCGFDNDDLPIGFQIIGNYFDEKEILNIGYKLEQKLDIYHKMPSLAKGGGN
jgi:aspartyl-tRNA(Asn)/glutamyl-tRNA(Gln) amidotransferase subunit A